MDLEKITTGISKEISSTLKIMHKAKTAEEKLKYSESIKNLCESLGVFFDFFDNMAPYGYIGDEDDEDKCDEYTGPVPF